MILTADQTTTAYLPDDRPLRSAGMYAVQCPKRNARGQRCRQACVRGTTLCRWHGGLKLRRLKEYNAQTTTRIGRTRMPRFYTRQLTKTLAEAVEAELLMPVDEQLQLREELSLLRQMAADAVKLWSDARHNYLTARLCRAEKSQGYEALTDAAMTLLAGQVDIAGAGMRDLLFAVKEMDEAAARMHVAGKDKLTAITLQSVVNQIVGCAYTAFGHLDQKTVEEFERLCRTEIKLPSALVPGTDITPDADVLDMDATVPREE